MNPIHVYCPKTIIVITKEADVAIAPWPECKKQECGCWNVSDGRCGLIHDANV